MTSHLNSLNTNKIMAYDVGNPKPFLNGVKPVIGIPTITQRQCKYKQTIKQHA